MCRHKLPGPDLLPAERATSKSSEQKTWERKQLQKGTLYSETLPLLWTLWPKPCDDICHAFIILNVWGNLCSTGVSGPSVFPVQISETACAAWAVVISDSFTAAWLITAMYVQHYLIKRWAGAETRLNPADVSVWNKTANAVWWLDQTTKPHDLSKALQPRAVEMFWDGGDTLFLNGLNSGWNMIFKWQDLTKA